MPQRSDSLVLFGVSGDLAKKKLFGALYDLTAKGALDLPVVGEAAPRDLAPAPGVLRNAPARGVARIVCYTPRHDLSLAEARLAATAAQLLGDDSADFLGGALDPAEVNQWELYVPENYDPDSPPGLLVFTHPTDSGRMPGRYRELLEERNLIWIGANRSGNQVRVARRASLALLATAMADRNYRIDASRVYVSGFSGGGRTASARHHTGGAASIERADRSGVLLKAGRVNGRSRNQGEVCPTRRSKRGNRIPQKTWYNCPRSGHQRRGSTEA